MAKYLSIFLFTGVIFFSSCLLKRVEEKDPVKNKEDMIKADRDFSAMSEAKGMKTAFLDYIDSNGVLLRPALVPIAGADAVDYLIAINDTGYSMSWKPKGGMVAQSGELGYTYGVYELRPKIVDTILYGTYVSIWKKQYNGKWKFVLDSGNEGVEGE